jgi:uncharacterized protein YceK
MKKICIFLFLLTILLAGCHGSQTSTDGPEPAPTPAERISPAWLDGLSGMVMTAVEMDGYSLSAVEIESLREGLAEARYAPAASPAGAPVLAITLDEVDNLTLFTQEDAVFLSDAGGCWHTAGEGLREFLDAAANERMVRSIFEELDAFRSGGAATAISLHHRSGGVYETYYDAASATIDACRGWCKSFVWRELEDAPENIREEAEYFITVGSEDEQLQYIFFSGEEGYTCKRVQDTESWYSGVSADGRYTLAVGVHQFYDALNPHVRYDRPFGAGCGPEEAAQLFASEIWRAYVLGWPPGGMSSNTAYRLLDCGIREIREDQAAVLAGLQCAIKPEYPDISTFWSGNTRAGEGELAGWLILSRQYILEKQQDGSWVCTDLGTGIDSLR